MYVLFAALAAVALTLCAMKGNVLLACLNAACLVLQSYWAVKSLIERIKR